MTDVLIAATIREEGPLRASVEVSIKISDSSYLKQMISLDADSPYLRVDCEVSYLHLYVWCIVWLTQLVLYSNSLLIQALLIQNSF